MNISAPRPDLNQKPFSNVDFFIKWAYEHHGAYDDWHIEKMDDKYAIRLAPTSPDACDHRKLGSGRFSNDDWTRGNHDDFDGIISSDQTTSSPFFTTTVAATRSYLPVPASKLTAFKESETLQVDLLFYSEGNPEALCTSIGLSMTGNIVPVAPPALPVAAPATMMTMSKTTDALPTTLPGDEDPEIRDESQFSRKKRGASQIFKGGLLLLVGGALVTGYLVMKTRSTNEGKIVLGGSVPVLDQSIELENQNTIRFGHEGAESTRFFGEEYLISPTILGDNGPIVGQFTTLGNQTTVKAGQEGTDLIDFHNDECLNS